MQARAATMSATRLVAGVPDAGEDRLGRAGHGPGHDLGLEGGEVGPRSPAADHRDDVAVAPAEHLQGPGDGGRRAGPLHA